MSEEPIFIRQTFDIERMASPLSRRIWIEETAAEARASGVSFLRVTITDDDESGLLLEGWRERPEDQGFPRWNIPKTQPPADSLTIASAINAERRVRGEW